MLKQNRQIHTKYVQIENSKQKDTQQTSQSFFTPYKQINPSSIQTNPSTNFVNLLSSPQYVSTQLSQSFSLSPSVYSNKNQSEFKFKQINENHLITNVSTYEASPTVYSQNQLVMHEISDVKIPTQTILFGRLQYRQTTHYNKKLKEQKITLKDIREFLILKKQLTKQFINKSNNYHHIKSLSIQNNFLYNQVQDKCEQILEHKSHVQKMIKKKKQLKKKIQNKRKHNQKINNSKVQEFNNKVQMLQFQIRKREIMFDMEYQKFGNLQSEAIRVHSQWINFQKMKKQNQFNKASQKTNQNIYNLQRPYAPRTPPHLAAQNPQTDVPNFSPNILKGKNLISPIPHRNPTSQNHYFKKNSLNPNQISLFKNQQTSLDMELDKMSPIRSNQKQNKQFKLKDNLSPSDQSTFSHYRRHSGQKMPEDISQSQVCIEYTSSQFSQSPLRFNHDFSPRKHYQGNLQLNQAHINNNEIDYQSITKRRRSPTQPLIIKQLDLKALRASQNNKLQQVTQLYGRQTPAFRSQDSDSDLRFSQPLICSFRNSQSEEPATNDLTHNHQVHQTSLNRIKEETYPSMESEDDYQQDDNDQLWGALGTQSKINKQTIQDNIPTFQDINQVQSEQYINSARDSNFQPSEQEFQEFIRSSNSSNIVMLSRSQTKYDNQNKQIKSPKNFTKRKSIQIQTVMEESDQSEEDKKNYTQKSLPNSQRRSLPHISYSNMATL